MDAKAILLQLHEAGGCDAADDYAKGWDKAIDEAIRIVSDITGVAIEDVLDKKPDESEEKKECSRSGMVKIPWEEVKQILRQNGHLDGYFYLYDDETEAEIDRDDSIIDIVEHHERGGEFGKEVSSTDKKRIRFSFYKEFNIEADLSEEEISRITAKDGDIPIRIWEDANDKDDEVPIIFNRYQEVQNG